MDELAISKEWHGKKVISLLGLTQLGSIILHNSGVVYTNQTGGYSCMQPWEEGILSIIGEDNGMSENVLTKLAKYTLNTTCINEEDADFIDDILRNDYSTFFLTVDRSKLRNSMEAWIYVTINEQPEVPIDAYEFTGIGKKEIQMYEKRYHRIERPLQYPFYGFGEAKGVLTWFNSD